MMIRQVSSRPVSPVSSSKRVVATTVEIAGEIVPLEVNWHATARRFTLRVDPSNGAARLTVPDYVGLNVAIAFLKRHELWLACERGKLDAPVPFVEGAVIPLRGTDHSVQLTGALDRRILCCTTSEGSVILIPGPRDMVAIQLKRWLKHEARSDISASVARHAFGLGVNPGRISLRDQRTRWGSCSSNNNLSFSWRLILAPKPVLDYVAAHEVAHLKEMNHGRHFWKLVHSTGTDVEWSRQWLTCHGQSLYRFG